MGRLQTRIGPPPHSEIGCGKLGFLFEPRPAVDLGNLTRDEVSEIRD